MLEEQQGESSQLREQDFPWKKFWAIKRVAPKIKSFLWRAFNNGIAVSQRISRRVEGASTICNICNSEEESVNHLLIHCNFAQAVGFASPFGLHIQGNPNMTLSNLVEAWLRRNDNEWSVAMGTAICWPT